MVDQAFTLDQKLFIKPHPPVDVAALNEAEVTDVVVNAFLLTAAGGVIGVAAAYGAKGVLVSIAFATASRVLHVRFSKNRQKSKSRGKSTTNGHQAPLRGREVLRRKILCHSDYCKVAFDMHRLATALFQDYGLKVTQAIDLQSVLPKKTGRQSIDTLLRVLGGETTLRKHEVLKAFIGAGYDSGDAPNVSLRAWASRQAASIGSLAKNLLQVPGINTLDFDEQILTLLSKFMRDADRLYALKPTKVKNDVKAEFSQKSGALNVECTRFKTHIRTSTNQTLVVKMSSKGVSLAPSNGRAVSVNGKSATIAVNSAVAATAKIQSIYTIGREDPTPAEEERTRATLSILQGTSSLFQLPLVTKMFFPRSKTVKRAKQTIPVITLDKRELNRSQAEAVVRINSTHDQDMICLVHGPPGTGKTTVIAACATNPPTDRCAGIWLVAQSNVAVKNIAEKLADVGFLDFKLLVSWDFHFDWHEHLYKQIEHNVIRSDDFADNVVGTSRLLLDSKVILCTLSMFSHPRLMTAGFTRLVPVETVIIDEASQIELGGYMPLLSKFGSGIKKLVFIGDNKQLAPYGQDDLGDLPSIFEMEHLRKDAVFLDTQYRMPGAIGSFISNRVYGGRLKTSHGITSHGACRLVDVHDGQEQQDGYSWVNKREAEAAVHVAKRLHAQGKAFRIITPYDPQRNLLERLLKQSQIPWENRCFNVDSFQGNEEENIIISVVRTAKVGFLSNDRRTNVMLSRCKQSMIICTSRAFVRGVAAGSLVGQLGAEWDARKQQWLSWHDVVAGRF
ncbi:predicted protein [Sparassis crispa]|uniref:DNA2/NAM7 helicase-like C-terminal domain-containing protein n=1 Tax=Sparassis crispa TaxID=139825 RepID=A0A401H1R6_9APHY|nr:predicted protein [Sparassis crispa]GBE88386.1 predicted protein [Sparassis crispa]